VVPLDELELDEELTVIVEVEVDDPDDECDVVELELGGPSSPQPEQACSRASAPGETRLRRRRRMVRTSSRAA
jgi:hypothetical protein